MRHVQFSQAGGEAQYLPLSSHWQSHCEWTMGVWDPSVHLPLSNIRCYPTGLDNISQIYRYCDVNMHNPHTCLICDEWCVIIHYAYMLWMSICESIQRSLQPWMTADLLSQNATKALGHPTPGHCLVKLFSLQTQKQTQHYETPTTQWLCHVSYLLW